MDKSACSYPSKQGKKVAQWMRPAPNSALSLCLYHVWHAKPLRVQWYGHHMGPQPKQQLSHVPICPMWPSATLADA